MNEHISNALAKPWVLPTAVGVGSGLAGLVGGYFAGVFHAKRQIISAINAEVAAVNYAINEVVENEYSVTVDETAVPVVDEDYSGIQKLIDKRTEEVLGRLEDRDVVNMPKHDPSVLQLTLPDIEGPAADEPEVSESPNDHGELPDEPAVQNIFAQSSGSDNSWNHEAELAARKADAPYVIHVDEFVSEEMGYHQQTLTYYADDHVLCDEANRPIVRHEELLGELKFGHGSNDATVVYIRNEEHQAEYEVIRDPGSYQVEVLAVDPSDYEAGSSLKHSDGLGKFRLYE